MGGGGGGGWVWVTVKQWRGGRGGGECVKWVVRAGGGCSSLLTQPDRDHRAAVRRSAPWKLRSDMQQGMRGKERATGGGGRGRRPFKTRLAGLR